MESYKDYYPDHAQGIIQEAIQNSVDARHSPEGFKDVVIVIEYDRGERILRIRDYGTTGMSHCSKCLWGIRSETGEDCHDVDCKWGNFHYLGGLQKGVQQLGYRGQGKSLAVVAGETLVVRTRVSGDERAASMASKWDREGDECFWELVPDEAFASDVKPGTELVIYGINDEVHNSLLDLKSLKADIQRTWFPVIEKGVRIRIGYAGGTLSKVRPPRFPTAAVTESGRAIKRRRRSIPVKSGREVVGELQNVELILAEKPVPAEIRGIALIKNGTQVIERLTSWGRKIQTDLQDRLYGWATYFTTEDRPFLLKCEQPSHRGHSPHPYSRKVKELLQTQVEDFLLPFAKETLKRRLTAKDRRRARQNLEIIQKALDGIPEFNPWSGEGTITEPPKPPEVPAEPYISSITLDKESYGYGETARGTVVVFNPTEEYQPFIHLTVEALDEGLSRLAIWDLPSTDLPLLMPASESEKGRIETVVDIPITEDFGEGRNWMLATLSSKPPPNVVDATEEPIPETLYDRKGHAVWVGAPPEKGTRQRRGGGSVGDRRRKGTLGNLVPITAPLDPIENEVIPMWSDAEIWFYTMGARIGVVYESNSRAADSILYELVAEAIADRILALRMDEDIRESLDKIQVLDEFRRLDDLRKDFLRSCENFRDEMGA